MTATWAGGEYFRKDTKVEAEQFLQHNGPDLAKWCSGEYGTEPNPESEDFTDKTDVIEYLIVPTRTLDRVTIRRGDWLVKQRDGFFVLSRDRFSEMYEEIEFPPDSYWES